MYIFREQRKCQEIKVKRGVKLVLNCRLESTAALIVSRGTTGKFHVGFIIDLTRGDTKRPDNWRVIAASGNTSLTCARKSKSPPAKRTRPTRRKQCPLWWVWWVTLHRVPSIGGICSGFIGRTRIQNLLYSVSPPCVFSPLVSSTHPLSTQFTFRLFCLFFSPPGCYDSILPRSTQYSHF